MKRRFRIQGERGFKSVNERLDHETASCAAEGMVMQGKQSRVAWNLNGGVASEGVGKPWGFTKRDTSPPLIGISPFKVAAVNVRYDYP